MIRPWLRPRSCFRVRGGPITRYYTTERRAEQMARALRLRGLTAVVDAVALPDDALTALTVSK